MGRSSDEGNPYPLLSDAELKVVAAVDDLTSELGFAPTYPQILERLGWSPKSKGTLHRYLERLRQRGVIEGRGRSLRLIR